MLWLQDLYLHNLSTASTYCTKILYASNSDCLSSIDTHHCYKHIALLALYLSLVLYQISTSLLVSKSPTRLTEPLLIKQKCLNTSLRDYLQINAFPELIVVEQKK